MKKRILSLIMAVCMVVLAVPMFLVPAAAELTDGPQTDGTFTTSFSPSGENWPILDDEADAGFSFRNGWTMASYDGDSFNEFKAKTPAGSEELLSVESNSMWSTGGVYMISGSHGGGWTLANGATAAVYTAPYEGTVDLSLDSLTISDAGGSGAALNHKMAIYVDGAMIWPVADGAAFDDWYVMKSDSAADASAIWTGEKPNGDGKTINLNALKGIHVNRGSTIAFAIGKGPEGPAGNMILMTPRVTFAAGYRKVPTTLVNRYAKSASSWPGINTRMGSGIGVTAQTDENWRLGYVDTSASALNFVETVKHYKSSVKTEVWGGNIPAPSENPDVGEEYYRQSGGIMFKSSNNFIIGNILFPADGNFAPLSNLGTIVNGYEYTVAATGTMKASFANITMATDNDAEAGRNTANAKFQLLIYVNGVKKLDKEVSTDATGAVNAVDYTETTGLSVTRGDKVVYLIAPIAGQSIVYVGGVPTIELTEIKSFMSSPYNAEKPVDLKVETAKVVVGHTFGLSISVFGTAAVYDADEVGVYVWPAGVEQTEANAQKYVCKESTSFSFDFTYNDLAIKELADVITIQAYAKIGNDTILAQEKTTKSMAQYVLDEYNGTTVEVRKDLCASLLNYAAAAQTYFGYNTANLANAALPDAAKELDGEYLYDSIMESVNKPTSMCYSEVCGVSVIFGNTLSLKVYVNVDPSEVDTAEFQICTNEDFDAASTEKAEVGVTKCYTYEGIGLDEMTKAFYMKASAKPNRSRYYGYTIRYSIESYVARIANDFAVTTPSGALVRAMMEFGNAIAAYKA